MTTVPTGGVARKMWPLSGTAWCLRICFCCRGGPAILFTTLAYPSMHRPSPRITKLTNRLRYRLRTLKKPHAAAP